MKKGGFWDLEGGSQGPSSHIIHAYLAQNNRGNLQVKLWELLPHTVGRVFKL